MLGWARPGPRGAGAPVADGPGRRWRPAGWWHRRSRRESHVQIERHPVCMHVRTCACTHMCTQPQGWLLSRPPPTQSRPPASCFPGAPSRAFTSPFSASPPPSLFTQSGGPSVPASQAVSPLPKPQSLPSSLQLSRPSQPPLPLLCPARPGKLSLDRPPAQEAPLMPPTCPPHHRLSSTAHVSPTPVPFPSSTQHSATWGVPVECFCLPHENLGFGKAGPCLPVYFISF